MIVCPSCGSQNRPNAKFCGGCRTPLVQGVGYGGGQQQSPPVQPPAGNMNPTIPESGGWPASGGAGARVGGAAKETTLEPPAGGQAHGPPQAGARGPAMAPGGTVYSEAANREVAGWLVVLRSRSAPPYADIPIYSGQNKLGRTQLADPEASGDHMIIAAEIGPGGVLTTLIDQGSRNGTVVNDRRVKMHQLQKDDQIRVGKTKLVFVPRPPLRSAVSPY